MSEKIDDNIDRLNQSLTLWEDVRKINEDIESWTSSCVIELNESLNNLNDSQKVSGRLSKLQVRCYDDVIVNSTVIVSQNKKKQLRMCVLYALLILYIHRQKWSRRSRNLRLCRAKYQN